MSGSEDDRDDFEPRSMMQGKICTFTDAGQLRCGRSWFCLLHMWMKGRCIKCLNGLFVTYFMFSVGVYWCETSFIR